MIVLVLLVTAMYAPFLGGGWLTDDFVHLERLERAGITDIFTTPDPFGFYRPIPHASLLLDLNASGPTPWAFRFTNLALHAAVVCASYVLATMLLGDRTGAFLATLAFVLTPKAHPVAVLWPSARPEIVMTLMALLTVIFWIRWLRSGNRRWLAASCAGCLLAVMSKESAVLLPLILLVTPGGSRPPTSRRIAAVGVIALTVAVVLMIRAQAGAITFAIADPHYDMTTPLSRWTRNGRNYFQRVLPSPLAMLVIVGFPALLTRRWRLMVWPAGSVMRAFSVFAAVWFLAFILPVLPIAGRSELYLYVPGFGICVLVGSVLARLSTLTGPRALTAAAAVYISVVGGYQLSRAISVHNDARFSTKLVNALGQHDALRRLSGDVVLVPEDRHVEELLRGSVAGYLGVALRATFRRSDISGAVAYPDTSAVAGDLRLICGYRNGEVVLNPVTSGPNR